MLYIIEKRKLHILLLHFKFHFSETKRGTKRINVYWLCLFYLFGVYIFFFVWSPCGTLVILSGYKLGLLLLFGLFVNHVLALPPRNIACREG